MSPISNRILLLAVIGSVTACSLDDGVIADESVCSDCFIELEPVVRLGKLEDPGSYDVLADVSRDSRGRYYVAPAQAGDRILVYGPDGTFETTMGPPGDGPGEVSWFIKRMEPGPGDTLYVVDEGLRRMTVFSPEHLLVRAQRLPFSLPADAWVFGPGEVFLQGWHEGETRADERQNFHIYTADYDLLASAGSVWSMRDWSCFRSSFTRLTASWNRMTSFSGSSLFRSGTAFRSDNR